MIKTYALVCGQHRFSVRLYKAQFVPVAEYNHKITTKYIRNHKITQIFTRFLC